LFGNAEIRPDEWVLVVGAAGGLGLLLVELVNAAGARVFGAAQSRGASRPRMSSSRSS
jgi:NADPH:quinone reductase